MKTRSTSRPDGEERRSIASAQAGAQLKQAAGANMPDTRATSLAQLKLQQRASSSSQAMQLKERADMMGGRGADAPVQRVEDEELLQGKFAVAQREEDEELLQGKFDPVQRMDEEDLLQGKFEALQGEQATPLQGKFEQVNDTGLPDQLKSGIESLSGMSMDHVKVHYNSDKPAQLQAHAYAQGSEIHVGPGQERHLPHEAWHVVQQAQGRVKPTRQMKAGVPVNDEVGLETEADVMGAKAMQLHATAVPSFCRPASSTGTGIQAKFYRDGDWMTDVGDDVLDNRFAETTRALWKALKIDGPIVIVTQEGSGASYSFNHRAIQISKDWLDVVKAYVGDAGQKDAKLMRATTALTHEMSHAHDHQIRKESPEGASTEKDDWVLGVLKTELRAWMNEARSGIENRKEKEMLNSDDDRDLQYSWVALKFVTNPDEYMALKGNLVIGRLNKYYTDNKSAGSSSLAELVAGGLNVLVADYATQIRGSYSANDEKMRSTVEKYMA